MSKKTKKNSGVSGIYGFALTWLALSLFLPLYKGWAVFLTCLLSALVAFLVGRMSAGKRTKLEAKNLITKRKMLKPLP